MPAIATIGGTGGAITRVPQVEDQTIVELRQDFSAGRDADGMDMGI